MKINAVEIVKYAEKAELIGNDTEITGIATDSGAVKKGDLFVCIKGERTDGHKYAGNAVENGAVCVLADRKLDINIPYIKVPDTVKALQQAAFGYRKTLDCKIVGVTGSVGKTTTKEFIAATLSSQLSVHKTDGNKNSETGVPITVLGIEKTDDAAVVEMGMSGLGEISLLSKIARPDIGVITNIGYSHIEHLKTRENILRAKTEIIDGMTDGVLILNGDDDMLAPCGNIFGNVLFYGITDSGFDYYGYDIKETETSSSFKAKTPNGVYEVNICLPGKHNVLNALAAIAAAEKLGVSSENIIKGLGEYKAGATRQNIYKTSGVTVYDDCYNSAPNSLEASLDVLSKMNGRKVAVLGDMLELGEMSAKLHENCGKSLIKTDRAYLYGDFAEDYYRGALSAGAKKENISVFSDKNELAKALVGNTEKGDVILFKASRGMHAEDIIRYFTENYR